MELTSQGTKSLLYLVPRTLFIKTENLESCR